jgi:hypothetical protein
VRAFMSARGRVGSGSGRAEMLVSDMSVILP